MKHLKPILHYFASHPRCAEHKSPCSHFRLKATCKRSCLTEKMVIGKSPLRSLSLCRLLHTCLLTTPYHRTHAARNAKNACLLGRHYVILWLFFITPQRKQQEKNGIFGTWPLSSKALLAEIMIRLGTESFSKSTKKGKTRKKERHFGKLNETFAIWVETDGLFKGPFRESLVTFLPIECSYWIFYLYVTTIAHNTTLLHCPKNR